MASASVDVVCAPSGEPAAQLLDRRRQDEHAHDIAAGLLVKLLRALPVDVEQHVPAFVEHPIDRRLGRSVAMIEDMRPFEELAVRDHLLEAIGIDEMIIDAIFFADALGPGGGANRHCNVVVGFQQHSADGRLSCARRGGQDDE